MNRPHAGLAGTVAAAAALLAALGPAVAPGSDGTSHSHNSVLAGIENTYGLSLPGGAATASPVPVPQRRCTGITREHPGCGDDLVTCRVGVLR